MKNGLIGVMFGAVFVFTMSFWGAMARAQETMGGIDVNALNAQVQSVMQSGAPEQAATLQLGLTPQQLNALVGPGNQQQQQPQQQKKYKYTPKDPTQVEMPPRLFNNIPKRH